MAEYKFKIGQTVYFHPKLPNDSPRGVYQIVRRLPAAEGEFQYVIRSTSEEHINVFPVLKDGDFSSESLMFQADN